ncbi:cell division protein FtsQ/DivIB [Flaviflexus huanghaiensis]|uniref:cell division protein FtsQ/DivIB n=1 Tax=Flaviflexus huanghaiensis TaxID=1111473 RepID=UPI0015FD70B3|nr:FtsQ-type POTRA domain-containing protein [Flaviflexus huanghaiensis]
MKSAPEKPPVPAHRKRSSDPYPLSEKIELRRRARRRALLIRLAVTAGVLALAGGAVWVLFFSSVFAVRETNVVTDDPAGVLNEAEISDILSGVEGTPVLRLAERDIEERLLAIPAVANARVDGVFPRGMDVEITARVPVACVGAAESCVGIDVEAMRLDVGPELQAALPKVTMDLDSGWAAEHLQGLLDALAALPDHVHSAVTSASVSESGLIEFALESGTIKWGRSEENEKKARVIAVLLTQEAGTYDVTMPNAPVTY